MSLTDEMCDEFRRKPCSFNDMIRHAYNAGADFQRAELAKTAKLRPMKDAPRDGTEILAYHLQGKNFHPVWWKEDRWLMRWNVEYCAQDGFYLGWVPYPTKEEK